MTDLRLASVAETARLVASGELSAREVTDAALERIELHNPRLNAISQRIDDRARAEADERDAHQAGGNDLGPLHGVPVVIKEELAVEGLVTTFGGDANSVPATSDAEVVRRLRVAGAVVVATSTMPEFGAWPYTESDARGITRNPWNTGRTPGGSSGGTAAAVSVGMVPAGMGGDGGGSIRIPSACCGLFGLKPQRGRVTSAPHEHLWFALGTAGPLTRTVLDSALVYDAIRGSLPTDTWHAGQTSSFTDAARREPGRLRVGWSTEPVTLGVKPDPVHVRAVQDTARLLTDLGHDVREVDPKYPDPTTAFVPQFLGGIRAEADLMDHFDRLERRTRQTYRLGGFVTRRVMDFALKETTRISVRTNRVFDDGAGLDVLLTPAIAHRPPEVGILKGKGTVRSALASMPAIAYAAIWNVAGNPAAAVPCGLAGDGLPVSVQLVGRTDGETTLLSLAAQLESARPWPLVAETGHGS